MFGLNGIRAEAVSTIRSPEAPLPNQYQKAYVRDDIEQEHPSRKVEVVPAFHMRRQREPRPKNEQTKAEQEGCESNQREQDAEAGRHFHASVPAQSGIR